MTAEPRLNHAERVYRLYLDRIRSGALGREDRLVDTVIAADLGISRMPVREALLRLTAEGYLEPSSRGFTLPGLTPAQIAEVFELRHLLEPRAVALCARSMPETAMDRLAQAIQLAETTFADQDVPRFFQASEAYRNGWIAEIPNTALRAAIQRYVAQVQLVRLATIGLEPARRAIVKNQRALLAAFRARDALAAHDIMRDFIVEGELSWRARAQA
jgi:DNA-binding GntR family transcriptional regulator